VKQNDSVNFRIQQSTTDTKTMRQSHFIQFSSVLKTFSQFAFVNQFQTTNYPSNLIPEPKSFQSFFHRTPVAIANKKPNTHQ